MPDRFILRDLTILQARNGLWRAPRPGNLITKERIFSLSGRFIRIRPRLANRTTAGIKWLKREKHVYDHTGSDFFTDWQ
jgi:hypothetical protein